MNEQQIKPIKLIPLLGKINDGEKVKVHLHMADTEYALGIEAHFVPMHAFKE